MEAHLLCWKRLMAVTHCVGLQTILEIFGLEPSQSNHSGMVATLRICLYAGSCNDAEESLLVLARGWALDSHSQVTLHVCLTSKFLLKINKVCWTLGIATFGNWRGELYRTSSLVLKLKDCKHGLDASLCELYHTSQGLSHEAFWIRFSDSFASHLTMTFWQ